MPSERASSSVLFVIAGACGGAAAPSTSTAPTNTMSTQGVRGLDWQNRAYPYRWSEGEEPTMYTVKDGRFEDPEQPMTLWVDSAVFGDLTGDGVEEAVVLVTAKAGDSLRYPFIHVYAAADGVSLLGQLDVGEVAGMGGTVEQLAVVDGTLRLVRYVTQEGDDFRYPTLARHERWRWTGTTLVEDEAARTTEPFDTEAYDERLEAEAGIK